jgi:predicted HTH domain antitoxin
MQISVELPTSLVALESVAKIQQDMRLGYALMLFRMNRVSISKASDIAGISLYAFMHECKQQHISVMDESMDFATELAGL